MHCSRIRDARRTSAERVSGDQESTLSTRTRRTNSTTRRTGMRKAIVVCATMAGVIVVLSAMRVHAQERPATADAGAAATKTPCPSECALDGAGVCDTAKACQKGQMGCDCDGKRCNQCPDCKDCGSKGTCAKGSACRKNACDACVSPQAECGSQGLRKNCRAGEAEAGNCKKADGTPVVCSGKRAGKAPCRRSKNDLCD